MKYKAPTSDLLKYYQNGNNDDLEEINQRVKLNDAKAVEVLAWMYTKGVGVKQNLVEAFKLYKKAESLQVSSAAQNASLVFKAMTVDEKAKIKD